MYRCFTAVLSLARSHLCQQLPLSWFQQHTQQFSSRRRVNMFDSNNTSVPFLIWFWVFFDTLFLPRNGSPNHQPEPVVQVIDVSRCDSFWIYRQASFCLAEPLHINIHKCAADIWRVNICPLFDSQRRHFENMSVNRNESNLSRDVRLNKAEIQGHTEDSGAVFNPLVIQKMVCIF